MSTPADQRAQMAVLGSILIDPEAMEKVAAIVRPEDFAHRRLRLIYEAMLAIHLRGEPADYVMVCCELEARGTVDEVGVGNLTGLINCSPTSLHVEHYARLVARLARRGAPAAADQEGLPPGALVY